MPLYQSPIVPQDDDDSIVAYDAIMPNDHCSRALQLEREVVVVDMAPPTEAARRRRRRRQPAGLARSLSPDDNVPPDNQKYAEPKQKMGERGTMRRINPNEAQQGSTSGCSNSKSIIVNPSTMTKVNITDGPEAPRTHCVDSPRHYVPSDDRPVERKEPRMTQGRRVARRRSSTGPSHHPGHSSQLLHSNQVAVQHHAHGNIERVDRRRCSSDDSSLILSSPTGFGEITPSRRGPEFKPKQLELGCRQGNVAPTHKERGKQLRTQAISSPRRHSLDSVSNLGFTHETLRSRANQVSAPNGHCNRTVSCSDSNSSLNLSSTGFNFNPELHQENHEAPPRRQGDSPSDKERGKEMQAQAGVTKRRNHDSAPKLRYNHELHNKNQVSTAHGIDGNSRPAGSSESSSSLNLSATGLKNEREVHQEVRGSQLRRRVGVPAENERGEEQHTKARAVRRRSHESIPSLHYSHEAPRSHDRSRVSPVHGQGTDYIQRLASSSESTSSLNLSSTGFKHLDLGIHEKNCESPTCRQVAVPSERGKEQHAQAAWTARRSTNASRSNMGYSHEATHPHRNQQQQGHCTSQTAGYSKGHLSLNLSMTAMNTRGDSELHQGRTEKNRSKRRSSMSDFDKLSQSRTSFIRDEEGNNERLLKAKTCFQSYDENTNKAKAPKMEKKKGGLVERFRRRKKSVNASEGNDLVQHAMNCFDLTQMMKSTTKPVGCGKPSDGASNKTVIEGERPRLSVHPPSQRDETRRKPSKYSSQRGLQLSNSDEGASQLSAHL